MEEKIQSVQYRDSEPSEFAHKPPKQEMGLSCSPGRLSPIGRSHRFDSVELGVVHIVASSFSVLVALPIAWMSNAIAMRRNVMLRVSWSRRCRSVLPAYC